MSPTITITNLCNSAVDETTASPRNILSMNSPTLINQLKDWQLRQNKLTAYSIPETKLVNTQDIKTDLLSKFRELRTDKCNIAIETKDIISIYRFDSKLDTDFENRPVIVKFVNTILKLKLIKNAFHLKNTSFSISIDRTIEEHSSYKALIKQNKELEKEEMLGNGSSKFEALLNIKKL